MYREGFTRIKDAATAAGEQAQPASVVAETVAHALRSRWPKTRYLVGSDAAIRAYLALLLPDRLNDWLLTRIVKLPRAADVVQRRVALTISITCPCASR